LLAIIHKELKDTTAQLATILSRAGHH
jgi:hypothetical protein